MPADRPPGAPPLDTARLTLRGHRREDFAESAAMWADAQVTRHIGGRPFGSEESWGRLLRYVGHWALLGYGYWVVRERATGRFVGEVGLANYARDVDPPLGAAPEAGWVLASWARGRGFATEAVRAVLSWADAELGAPRTVCLVDPENAASLRVADKCGYGVFARGRYKGEAVILLERPGGR